MSKIDDQIKDLILKKKKVELLQVTLKTLDVVDGDFAEIKDEVTAMVRAFVDAQSEMIAEGKTSTSQADSLQFAVEEFKVLQDMARKLIQKASAPPQTNTNFEAPQTNPKDKVAFALANRHFEAKRVRVATVNGSVDGSVVGIDAPFIVVKTDTGYTVSVEVQNLNIIS